MIKTKLSKIAVIALSMSMLLAMPAYAGTNADQAKQNKNHLNNVQVQKSNKQNNSTQLNSAAQYMVSQGIIKGHANGNYNMSDNVKRGDMSIMLVRAFNLPNSSINSKNFFDVYSGSYYYDAIQSIKNLGIAKGDGKNFKPNNKMTLEEAILFVERALDSVGYKYSDTEIRDLFDGSSFSDYATREDVATIIYAVLGGDSVTTSAAIDYVTYKANENTPIAFDEDDFNDVCKDATDETFSYVKFTLPSTTYGTLYYDYTSSSDYDSKVTSTTKYYFANDGKALGDVSFVPTTNYSGIVKITYTAYTTKETSYNGIVELTVKDDETVADTITYETDEDTAIALDEDDFNDVCKDATDETLSYVKFTLPSTTYGTLYYDYISSSDYDSKVTSTTKYYFNNNDGKALGDVTFVPTSDYTGTVKITYIAYNKDGKSFTGTIKITVK